MTEAVSLALMALVGVAFFIVASIALVCVVLPTKPSSLKFWTGYGHFEIHYDDNDNNEESDE